MARSTAVTPVESQFSDCHRVRWVAWERSWERARCENCPRESGEIEAAIERCRQYARAESNRRSGLDEEGEGRTREVYTSDEHQVDPTIGLVILSTLLARHAGRNISRGRDARINHRRRLTFELDAAIVRFDRRVISRGGFANSGIRDAWPRRGFTRQRDVYVPARDRPTIAIYILNSAGCRGLCRIVKSKRQNVHRLPVNAHPRTHPEYSLSLSSPFSPRFSQKTHECSIISTGD